MYSELSQIGLRSGETVEAGVVLGPDEEWKERIVELLKHKGQPWVWQIRESLDRTAQIETRFYLTHRGGRPFSNVMTAELTGVGILGHVWTRPEDRRQGAMSGLLALQMEDFRARGGRALFLGTGYGTHPYRMYEKFGFGSVEPESGYMEYYRASRAKFESWYFAPGEAELAPLDWKHWPASPALFLGDFPGVVRCAPMGLFGRASTEGALPEFLREELPRRAKGAQPRAYALRSIETTAVVGMLAWAEHPLWPGRALLDLYCHPDWWERAPELLRAPSAPEGLPCTAYADPGCPHKLEALRRAGFREVTRLPRWLARDKAKSSYADAVVLERR